MPFPPRQTPAGSTVGVMGEGADGSTAGKRLYLNPPSSGSLAAESPIQRVWRPSAARAPHQYRDEVIKAEPKPETKHHERPGIAFVQNKESMPKASSGTSAPKGRASIGAQMVTNHRKAPGWKNEDTLSSGPYRISNQLCFADLWPANKQTRSTITSAAYLSH